MPRVIWYIAGLWKNVNTLFGVKKYKHVISCVVGLWKTLPRVIWYVAGLWRNFNMLFGVFCGEHQHAVYCVAGPWEKTKKN